MTEPSQDRPARPRGRSDSERSASGCQVGEPLPYAVAAKTAAAAAPRPRAAFIAHGMGQQPPFATLDQLAAGLRREDARRRGIPERELPRPVAREVVVDGAGDRRAERLGRLELRLARAGGGEQEVHLYEGYWSYLTEGKVTLRNVMGFLFRAGRNGVRHGLRAFPRWLFGEVREFPAEIRSVVYLLFGLGMVAALVEINAIIVAVAAARAPFAEAPSWLSPGLFADLTTTFNLLLAVYAAVGLAVLVSILLRRWAGGVRRLRRLVLLGSAVLFYLALVATPVAGVAVPILLYLHGQCVTEAEVEAGREFWPEVLGGGFVAGFNASWERAVLVVAVVAAAGFLLIALGRFVAGLVRTVRDPSQPPGTRTWTLTTVVLLVFGGLAVAAVAWYFGRACGETGGIAAARRGLAWPLFIALSGWIRSLLVQYVGDVAVYVDAHVLDRFHEVRERICSRVQRKAHAVYAATVEGSARPAYEEVAVVGHSLGSVLVYDVLNRLITDDELARARSESGEGGTGGRVPLGVAGRTRLLLTFGSPLDKVAFLFGLRAGDGELARELINAWRQPLIREARFRPFRWLNVYAPADIFSGRLDYFDPPRHERAAEGHTLPRPVDNVEDDDALTLLAAHGEYWGDRAVFAPLYEELTR